MAATAGAEMAAGAATEIIPQAADHVELGLEVDIVRELEVLDEAGGLDVVAVGNDEFLVLGDALQVLAEFTGAEGAVDQ